jgi:hypothetical protein
MKATEVYIDRDGHQLALASLDAGERQLVARLRRRARTNPDWNAFDNYWTVAVPAFYRARGLSRKAATRTAVWRIAQDLSSRLGIASGLVRPDDYLGDLENLIREKFQSQRAFCKATGISEDILTQILAGREDLAVQALTAALERIGYVLRIAPLPAEATTAARKRTG